MKKVKLIIVIVILGLIVIWYNSGKEQPPLSGDWSAGVSNNDFIEFINQLDNATNIDSEERFFFDDVNSEIKIEGTDRILLVSQRYLNSSVNLPEFLIIQWFARKQNSGKNSLISSLIRWVTRKRNSSNDILFEGKDIRVEKSLIVDIKAAIASQSNEIAQSVLDAKTASENFSFTFTFHHFDNGYRKSLMGENDDKFNGQRTIKIRGTENDYLFAFRNDLDTDLARLPDWVQVVQAKIRDVPDRLQAALSLRRNLRSRVKGGVFEKLQADAELLMVPKSVIEEMRAPLLSVIRGIKRENNKWFSLVSINVAFGGPLEEVR